MKHLAGQAVRLVRARGLSLLDRLGPTRSERATIAEAAAYWSTPASGSWQANSHWHDGISGHWEHVGTDHLALYRKLARVLDRPPSLGTVVEWGVGGGANAAAFAPHADRFIAVDVVADSLEESRRRTAAVCDTPYESILIDVESPETAIGDIGHARCDLFLCVYVLELVPSPAYALRILDIARQLLTPTGTAFVQIKYRDHHNRRPPKRNYARNLASQTVFPIDDFWTAAVAHGFDPHAVYLVPRNDLDKNYAYLLLTPSTGHPNSRQRP